MPLPCRFPMATQLSNNIGTESPGGLSPGLVACKAGSSSTEWIRGLEKQALNVAMYI